MASIEEELANLRNNYTFEELRSAACCKIYAGERLEDNEQVAIKVIERTKDILFIDSLPAEICLLRQLKNEDGVIQIFNYIECIDGYIIITEYSSKSMDLCDYWTTYYPLTMSKVKKIMLQIVEICIRLQKLNIYHGDLKLENIIIDPETLIIKLIDFGLGGYISEISRSRTGGTFIYIPPEVYHSKIYYAEAAHVWAIGIILFEIVGKRRADDSILEKDTILYSRIGEQYKNVIAKCLKQNFRKRIKFKDLMLVIENEWVDSCE
ncbi:hypothetical protein NPIL_88711 [Nephila pilipes]|uniref:Serine/threonine-protein kinase 1 n=1 Tax=Nephila pilipes TaxID=299642 RepID=A0A8X6N578_NEPPI|nr:hypothetical protein NPIL_88711 [Nephila pilipes]